MKTKSKLKHILRWDVDDYDVHDNTVWAAVGGSTDGEGGDLYYRIRQEVQDDKHYFVEASSPELMADEECPRRWRSKQAAMNAMQRDFSDVMKSFDK